MAQRHTQSIRVPVEYRPLMLRALRQHRAWLSDSGVPEFIIANELRQIAEVMALLNKHP